MRLIIAGSRGASEADVRAALCRCPWSGFVSAVVSGGARGADAWGERWASERMIEVLRFNAEWERFGKRAGPIRNEAMARSAEALIAVWDGESRGTSNMIERARQNGLRVFVWRYREQRAEEFAPAGELEKLWHEAEERAGIWEFESGMTRASAELNAGQWARESADRSPPP